MNSPVSVKRTRTMMLAAAGLWLVFGVVRLMMLGGAPDENVSRLLTVALIMVGNGLVFAISAFMLYKRQGLWFYVAFFVLSTNIFLTVTGQIVLLDLIALLINAAALVFLIQSWEWYKGN